MTTVGHSSLPDIDQYDSKLIEREALMAAQSCIERAIEAMPDGEGSEAYINMNNVMRQLGCDQQAHKFTWMQIGRSFNQDPAAVSCNAEFIEPEPFDCRAFAEQNNEHFARDADKPLNVVCVKYGTKYGADYVNKLYFGVKRHLSTPHTFTCFTEDASGLDPNVLVQPLRHSWQTWWSKVHIFESEVYRSSSSPWVLYIDLDMIITGSLDELVAKIGTSVKSFATLSTDEIFCENVSNGYNSSVMLFHKERTRHLYEVLERYYGHIMKYLMRFDHYLEMLVANAEIVQKIVPGHLIDYCQHFKVNK